MNSKTIQLLADTEIFIHDNNVYLRFPGENNTRHDTYAVNHDGYYPCGYGDDWYNEAENKGTILDLIKVLDKVTNEKA